MSDVIGLTGLYCAGKNQVAALLEKQGIPVLDVDKLGHKAIETEKAAIAALFGEDVLAPDGAVDRGLLGKKVFGSAARLSALEAIVHPAANRLTEEWIAAQTPGRLCVINAALLHKSAVFSRLKAVILVKAPLLTRLIRAKKRDALSLRELAGRFASQAKFNAQYFKGNADIYSIGNPGFSGPNSRSGRKLEKRLDEILNTIERV